MNTSPRSAPASILYSNLGKRFAFMVALLLVAIAPISGTANDEAAEIAAGGIVPRNEKRILIEKERLIITCRETTPGCDVRVEYEFFNESDEEVTTLVAFPIPEYGFSFVDSGGGFEDFKVWVNGRPLEHETEYRALVGGQDYTDFLASLGVNIATFGNHFVDGDTDTSNDRYQIAKLSTDKQDELLRMGLVDKRDAVFPLGPLWLLRKKYFWKQTFPARKTVTISHFYTAREGFTELAENKQHKRSFWTEMGKLPDTCIDDSLLKRFKERVSTNENYHVHARWVKYILTSANTWKTPIKEFELTVEQPPFKKGYPVHVSFCWDGKIERAGKDKFVAKQTHFVPTKDLTIYFFVETGEPDNP